MTPKTQHRVSLLQYLCKLCTHFSIISIFLVLEMTSINADKNSPDKKLISGMLARTWWSSHSVRLKTFPFFFPFQTKPSVFEPSTHASAGRKHSTNDGVPERKNIATPLPCSDLLSSSKFTCLRIYSRAVAYSACKMPKACGPLPRIREVQDFLECGVIM